MTKLVQDRVGVLLLALAAHSGWALYPVLNKALLAYLSPFTLLMVANGISLVIAFFAARSRLSRVLFSNRALQIFALVTAARSITNILAIKYTLAIYVQLINLSTPFFAAWLGRLLLKEPIPPYTFHALAISSLGAYLVISPDPLGLQLPHSLDDLLGIALALVSSAFLGLYMTWSRKMTTHDTHPIAAYFQQTLTLVILYVSLSLLGRDDWGVLLKQPAQVWVGVIALALVVLVGAALLQIWTLSQINAALFSTLISWRLVVALIAAWLLLGEKLVSAWQIVGALLVMATVTIYLARQALHHPASSGVC